MSALDSSAQNEIEIELPGRRSNRPITPIHVIEYVLLQGLFGFFRLVGIDAASAIAGKFMRVVGPLVAPISRRADDNLQHAFPEWTAAARKKTIADVWENLGRTTAEFAHLDKFRAFEDGGRIEVIGANRFAKVRESGKPAIFVSGHFANWELMAITLAQAGIETAVIYRAANNPLVDGMIIKRRARVMSRIQIPKGKRGGRGVIDALRNGVSLALLADQKLNDGIAVPFMGREAMTAPAAARLSLKFGAPIIPGTIVRLRGAHFRLLVHDPIDYRPTGDAARDVRALTQLVNESIERDIKARPGQWLWLHRRWSKPRKKQPVE